MQSPIRAISIALVLFALAACAAVENRPATAPTTDVNPITGSRGGSGGSH